MATDMASDFHCFHTLDITSERDMLVSLLMKSFKCGSDLSKTIHITKKVTSVRWNTADTRYVGYLRPIHHLHYVTRKIKIIHSESLSTYMKLS